MFIIVSLLSIVGFSQAVPYGAAYAPAAYGHVAYAPAYAAPAVYAAPAQPIYAKSYIPTTVKVGESHFSYPVATHSFTRKDWETPGATYAIPAVKTFTVTRPGYTTYLQSAITKAHVSNHLVAGPTVVNPIVAPVVTKALAPVAPVAYAPHAYQHAHY